MVVSITLTLLLRNRHDLLLAAVCLLGFCAGGTRASLSITHINVDQFSHYGNDPEVTVIGTVIDEPQVRDRSVAITLQAESLYSAGAANEAVQGRILIRTPRYPVLQFGERIRVTGALTPIENWSDFDYREHLARQNIFYQMNNPQIVHLGRAGGIGFYPALHTVRDHAQAVIMRLFPHPENVLLSGILLGDDSGMDPQLRDDFRATDMSHIIAISGFNIAVLAGALLRAGRWLLGGRGLFGLRASGWLAMGGIVLYTLFVGAEASVVRAAIMGSLYILSNRVLGRPTFAPAGLFVAAMLMSLADPHALWEIGFQLSFAATLGLMLFVAPSSRFVREKLEKHIDGGYLARVMPAITDLLLVTIAAQLMTIPLLAYHFGEFSPVSLLANLLILPVQPGVMLWGGAATLVGLVSPALAQPLAWIAWLFLTYTTTLVELLADLPFALAPVQPSFAAVILLYLLILGGYWFSTQSAAQRQTLLLQARNRAAVGVPTLLIFSLGLTFLWSRTQPDGRLHISFLDVGQGDAVFIQTPSGRQMLVDGGQFPSVLQAHLGRQMPFWDRRLDIIVATHPDDDHIAGLPELFARYDADLLLTNGAEASASRAYEALLQEAASGGVRVRTPSPGERLQIDDGVAITFLHPGPMPLESDNDNSVSLRLTYGDFSLLLTGDAELEAERAMVASNLPLDALVFKAGHHGSRSSSNAFFLQEVQPQIMVISSGADNEFGHPHPELLQRAAAAGATVLRTDELGTITVVSDGRQMWWETER